MAKGRRSGDKRSIRLFDTSVQTGLAELGDRKFDDEKQMHRLIEDNIGTLFPGLTFLKSEFSEVAKGERRLDTVAFDTDRNTFVVLEYKNRLNAEAIDQARTYLADMGDDQAELVILYNDKTDDNKRKPSFNWKEMYAIIMAPEFGKFQIRGADKDSNVELYKIRMYGERMMLMERVGGGHERTMTATPIPNTSPKTTRIPAEASSSGSGAEAARADRLYGTIRARMLGEFPGAEEHKKKFYVGFRYHGGRYFCTMALQKSKIWLAYSGRRAASELKPDDFVRDVDGWGVGKYRSKIRSEADFEKALVILKRLLANTPDVGAKEGDEIDQLYSDACTKLLSAFPGMVREKRKLYDRFSVGDRLLCTMGKQKSKIWLHYSRLTSNPAPGQPEFVTFDEAPGWGTGRYRSAIRSMVDFERALAILKKLHADGSGGTPQPATPSLQANGTRVLPEKMIERALQLPYDRAFYTAAVTVRPPIADGDRTILTFGGLDHEDRFHVSQQTVVIPDSFSQVAAAVEEIQNHMTPTGGKVTVLVDTTGRGASLWNFLRKSGIRDCWGFERKEGKMDAAYGHLRAELAEGRVFLQDQDSSNMDELCEQLRGIVKSDDGTITEYNGSDRAASLAIAVRGAKQTDGQNHKPGSGTSGGSIARNKPKRILPGRVRIRRSRF